MTSIDILEMYREETYCLTLPETDARERLILAGYIRWVPGPTWAGSTTYAITEKGLAYREGFRRRQRRRLG